MAPKEMPPVRILIADDHRMVREGLRAMLSLTSAKLRFEIQEAETTEEAIAKNAAQPYDVVLMDYHLPGRGGPKATEIILDRHPSVAVVCLSSYDERFHVDRMLAAGAKGYILKNIEPDTLVFAIKTVLAGRPFYSNEIALKLMDPRLIQPEIDPLARLTPREREVFRLILSGLRDREIAEKMGVGKRAIDKHRQHLMAKLSARNAVELVQAGVRMRLVG
jgi:DNA-binding NarL/FixJ family response regulator